MRPEMRTSKLSSWATRFHQLEASSVLHCLLYLVPSDLYLLEILADDCPPVLTRASRPSPDTIGFPIMSLTWDPRLSALETLWLYALYKFFYCIVLYCIDPVTFHAWKMSELSQSSASSNLGSAVVSPTLSLCPSRICPECFAAIYGVLLQLHASLSWFSAIYSLVWIAIIHEKTHSTAQ